MCRIYRPLEQLTNIEIKNILEKGDLDELIKIPLCIGENHNNWKYAQEICVKLSNYEDARIRANAVLGFAYIARTKGMLEKHIVKPIVLRELKENKENKMKKIIGLSIIFVLSICLFSCNSQKNVKADVTDEEAMGIAMESLKEEVKDAEPNTSEMVDKITLKAREDAKTATDKQKQDALNFIVDNRCDYFTGGNETMENIIYYGALLDYCYDDSTVISNIGTDAVQVVKYVYRGAETIEDEATLENLRQIDKDIEKLNN